MDKIKAGDIDVAYTISGEGHPLVMIQGLTATMDWWDPAFIEELSKRYRVLAFDNRGAGRTEAPDGEFSVEQFADDTANLMDALGIDKAYVLGYSLGGMIAQELALRHPEKVEKLILCSTNCGAGNWVVCGKEVLAVLTDRSGTPRDLVDRFCTVMFDRAWIKANRDQLDEFKRRYLIAPTSDHNAARQFMTTVKFDAFDRLGDINVPALVLTGADDLLIPAENSRIIAGALPDAKLKEYPGAGHGFTYQCRDEFLADVMDFLG